MLTAEEKSKIIGEYKLSEDDTGSFEVQVAMLSKRILALTEHLQSHRKDFSSKRGTTSSLESVADFSATKTRC